MSAVNTVMVTSTAAGQIESGKIIHILIYYTYKTTNSGTMRN